MTYEQMEKTMRFILDQQAAMTAKHGEFEEWRKQTAAESAERNRQVDQRFDQMIAASTEQNHQVHESLTKISHDLAILAADSNWHKDSIDEHEILMNQFAEQTNRLTDRLDKLIGQMASLSSEVNELTATVKSLIKGGSNGWTRN